MSVSNMKRYPPAVVSRHPLYTRYLYLRCNLSTFIRFTRRVDSDWCIARGLHGYLAWLLAAHSRAIDEIGDPPP
jgi:hypothetical protein